MKQFLLDTNFVWEDVEQNAAAPIAINWNIKHDGSIMRTIREVERNDALIIGRFLEVDDSGLILGSSIV